MKRNKKPLDREQLLEQMRALACAKVNDAVKLAYLPEEEREAIGKLDLSALIEFRRSGAGTVELKFADRMKALERLLELSGPSGEEQLDSLFRRMEDEEGWKLSSSPKNSGGCSPGGGPALPSEITRPLSATVPCAAARLCAPVFPFSAGP